MQGEIGTLIQDGQQIGGFGDWVIDLRLISAGMAQEKTFSVIKASTSKFWLLSVPTDSEITANYYQLIRGQLVLMNSHVVDVALGSIINKMINRPLVMIWMNS
jgi:hypothetical protein